MKKPTKSTKLATITATEGEIKKVVFWILDGNSMFDVNEVLKKEFKTIKKQRAVMTGVLDYFVRSGQANTDVVRGWCLESLRELYRKMIESGDFVNAARTVRDIYKFNEKGHG